MSHLIRAALVAAVLLSPATVGAQGANATPVADSTPRVLAPTPAGLALADTLLREMEFEALTRASAMATFDISIEQQPVMATFRDIMDAWVAKHMSLAEMGPAIARLYAETFTEDELRGLIAFYRTPVGRQLARLSPRLAEQGARVGAAVARAHAPELEQQMRDRMAAPKAPGTPE